MSTNKAIVVTKFDLKEPELELIETPIPTPGNGQVLVKITHRPVNPADLASLRGTYGGFQPKSLPATPGLEGSGEIAAVGEGVTSLKVGRRVHLGINRGDSVGSGGVWQQYAIRGEGEVFPIPDALESKIDAFQAATLTVNPQTALSFLDVGESRGLFTEREDGTKGWILSNAASSALGLMLVRLAKRKGYKTVNVIRSEKYVKALEEAGADVVLVSGRDDIAAETLKATGGRGVDIALEPVGGDGTAALFGGIRAGGSLFVYGALESHLAQIPIGDILFRDVSVHGFWLSKIVGSLDPAGRGAKLAQAAELVADGTLSVQVGQTFPIEQFKEALAAATTAGRNEKVFIVG